MILAAGVINSGVMSFTRGDVAYSLGLVWAYTGIALKLPDNPTVAYGAWISVALILALLISGYLRGSSPQQALHPA